MGFTELNYFCPFQGYFKEKFWTSKDSYSCSIQSVVSVLYCFHKGLYGIREVSEIFIREFQLCSKFELHENINSM